MTLTMTTSISKSQVKLDMLIRSQSVEVLVISITFSLTVNGYD